jgi:hypothetical protein
MSDLPIDGTSEYATGGIDTATTLVNASGPGATDGSPARAQNINGLSAAILQIISILGTGTTLKGSAADLVTRLAVEHNADGTQKTLTVGKGGTGATTLAAGAVISNGTVLSTETLAVARGGTGVATLAANGVMLGNTTGVVQVTAAGSASTVLAVASGGGAPAFVTVKSGMLATSTGSASGDNSVVLTITMNDYAFFPALWNTENAAGGPLYAPDNTADPSNTVGRFMLRGGGGGGANVYGARWRYITASDDPVIWIAVDVSGVIKAVWCSDDPTPGDVPGVRVEGCTSIRLTADDLDGLALTDLALVEAEDRIASYKLNPKHLTYRALQVHTADPAPSAWLLAHATWNTKAKRLTVKEARG